MFFLHLNRFSMKRKDDILPDKVTKFEVKSETLNGYADAVKDKLQGAKEVILNLPERITSATQFPPKTPALVINGTPVAHYSNIVGITGQMKSGKTAVNAALCAAALTDTEILGLVVPNLAGRNVVYFDTEQAGQDTQTNVYNRVCKLVGLTDVSNFYAYNLRGLGMGDMLPITDAIFNLVKPGIIVIDGCADYVASVNDEIKSREIIAYFLRVAELYNSFIILILHDNHNTEKSRGHLGSELDRKAEAVLITQKDAGNGVFTLRGKFYRSAGSADHVQYQYNTETSWFEFLQYINPSGAKVDNRKAEAERLAGLCFADAGQFSYTDLYNKIAKVDSCDTNRGKNLLRAWLKLGVISKTNDGFYILTAKDETPF